MPKITVGRVRAVPAGEYDPARSYEAALLVMHEGNVYQSLRDVPAGAYPTAVGSVYWMQVGWKGEPGRDGAPGLPGAPGPQGIQGPPGEQIPISDSLTSPDSGVAASSRAVKTAFDRAEEAFAQAEAAEAQAIQAEAVANELVSRIVWDSIPEKPETFPPTAHTHNTADIDGGILPLERGGTGNTSGAATSAASATKLAVARNFRVNLASTANAAFDGSGTCNPGVTGVLAVASGGTGGTGAAAARTNLGVPMKPTGGNWKRIYASDGATLTLPSGGTWAYYVFREKELIGVAAGGTVLVQNAEYAAALVWRIA